MEPTVASKRSWLWVILVFSFIGMTGALIATYQFYQIKTLGFETKSFCTISEFINCDSAYASSFATLGGYPISWLGFLFYLFNAILVVWIILKDSWHPTIAGFASVLSLVAVMESIHKLYILFSVLKVLCLICLVIHVTNFVLLLSWYRMRPFSFKEKLIPLSLFAFFFFAIGAIGIRAYQIKNFPKPNPDISIPELVQYHFRQDPYPFEPDENAPVWGNPNAKVTLVEFSDFQCPYCRHAAFHIKPVLSEFKNKVRYFFYNYPLDKTCNDQIEGNFHPMACLSAYAVVCADKKGDFWQFHDDIFREQKTLSEASIMALAKKRGWDEKEFSACLQDPSTLEQVKQNIEKAKTIFVQGTPTILINNRRVKHWSDENILRAIVQEEIRRSQK